MTQDLFDKKCLVNEIFHSIQGESSLSGYRFGFIRLTGCDLRCHYCDTSYSFTGGESLSIGEILNRLKPWDLNFILLTGGEPLLQKNSLFLLNALIQSKYQVSIETHGQASIKDVPKECKIIFDVKTPGSGEEREKTLTQLKYLKPTDEIKFVLTSHSDYLWAKEFIKKDSLPCQNILFSPAVQATNQPGHFEGISIQTLANLVIQDKLSVRLQHQFHKSIWGPNAKGV